MHKKIKIYILHGWTNRIEKWDGLLEQLKSAHIEPVFLKIPGLSVPMDDIWVLDDYVEWLRKIVIKEREKVVLLGHSNGGRISLAFALKYPDRVERLILIDSAGVYHNELPLRIKRFIFGGLAKAGKKISSSELMRNILYKLSREHDYQQANPVLRSTMRNLIRVDLANRLNEIHIRTTVIWGEHDTITPLSDGQIMHQKIIGSTFYIIAGAKHSPQYTHPGDVANIVVNELRTSKSQASSSK